MKFIILAASLFISTFATAELVTSEDANGVDLLKIAGDYSNSLGSELEVEVTLANAQQDFFEGPDYNVSLRGAISEETQLDASGFRFETVEEDGTIVFERSDDCDTNTCISFEGVLAFKPKKKGGYYVSVDVSAVSWDYEDPIYLAADHFIDSISDEDFLKIHEEEVGETFSGELDEETVALFIEDRLYEDHSFLDLYGSKKYFPKGPKDFICKIHFGSVPTITKDSLYSGEGYSDCHFEQKIFLKKN